MNIKYIFCRFIFVSVFFSVTLFSLKTDDFILDANNTKNQDPKVVITIDGPAGSGKSSVAKKLVEKLNYYYLSTGLIYRAMAYIWSVELKKDVNQKLEKKDLDFINDVVYKFKKGSSYIFYLDKDITPFLNTSDISVKTSIFSCNELLIEHVYEFQRNLLRQHNLVVEGRDAGSVVFPNANYKFFLTADLEVRAKRIFNDKSRINKKQSFEDVKNALIARDLQDEVRAFSSEIIPKQSVVIDNSFMSLSDELDFIINHIQGEPFHN